MTLSYKDEPVNPALANPMSVPAFSEPGSPADQAAASDFLDAVGLEAETALSVGSDLKGMVVEYDSKLIAALSEEKPARMPKEIPGLTVVIWQRAINAAALLYTQKKEVSIDSIKAAQPWMPRPVLAKLFAHSEFSKALQERGVGAEFMGLSDRQMMVLAHLTNFTDKRSESAKLKQLGVAQWEFQTWLSGNHEFSRQYREASERLFREAQAAVNVALVQESTKGNVGAIKYFNQLSGRYDPNSVNSMNVQQVLQAVVEILSEVLSDQPEILRTIGGRLALVAGGSGSFSQQQITGS